MYRRSLGDRHIGAEAAQLLESTPTEPKRRRADQREGADPRTLSGRDMAAGDAAIRETGQVEPPRRLQQLVQPDRNRVVYAEDVSGRVDLGGRSIMQKKNTSRNTLSLTW